MNARVLLIDNYDSFTYNLVQYLRILGAEVTVRRNDEIRVSAALDGDPTHLVISPGPGRPENAGITQPLVEALLGKLPILGVCLGHQALAQALGGAIVAAKQVMHGKQAQIYHDERTLYQGLPNPFDAGRYHSLAVAEEGLPDELKVAAYTSDGEIMGLRHEALAAEGVQFHPESILTREGRRLLRNFLDMRPDGEP